MAKKNKEKTSSKDDFLMLAALICIVMVFIGGFLAIKYFSNLKELLFPEKEDNETDVIIEDTLVYNGFTFEKVNGIWYTNIVLGWLDKKIPYSAGFYYPPNEVENVSFEKNTGIILKLKAKHTVYISVDPDLDAKAVLAGTEISKILGKVFFIDVKAGLTKPSNNPDFPVITCEDISNNSKVVIIQKANETRVRRTTDGCIFVEGPDEDELIRAADRLAYNLLDIDKRVIKAEVIKQ
ncbi:hypothetical protein JXB41_08865 [Candidatus Woesearchaeota archaeon]|nr:hypothetical protein [Candidatus Woesearchaeota archaeon]